MGFQREETFCRRPRHEHVHVGTPDDRSVRVFLLALRRVVGRLAPAGRCAVRRHCVDDTPIYKIKNNAVRSTIFFEIHSLQAVCATSMTHTQSVGVFVPIPCARCDTANRHSGGTRYFLPPFVLALINATIAKGVGGVACFSGGCGGREAGLVSEDHCSFLMLGGFEPFNALPCLKE